MKDTTLLAFHKAAETKSMTAAARELYISTPSLKQCIDNLEKEVGFPVFSRSHKGVSLTNEGHILYEGSKKLLDEYQKLLRTCCESYRQSQNILRIGISVPSVLSELCNEFSHAFPDIQLQFLTLEGRRPQDMLDLLKREDVDLLEFMNMGLHDKKSVCFLSILEDHLCALVSPTNPLAKKDCVDLRHIANQTVFIAEADVYSVPVLTKYFQEHTPKIALNTTEYTDTAIMNSCTASSFYLMESFYAQKYVAFRSIPLRQKIIFEIGIAYQNKTSALVRTFLEFAKERMGNGTWAEDKNQNS